MGVKDFLPTSPKDYIWGLISGLILSVVPQYLICKEKSEDWKLTEKQFYRWRENFDHQLQVDFEAFLNELHNKGLRSGDGFYMKAKIDFFMEKRRQMDVTIDSFLVEYIKGGGDTLNLKFKRKLGVDVYNLVYDKRHNEYFVEQHLRSLRLDTL